MTTNPRSRLLKSIFLIFIVSFMTLGSALSPAPDALPQANSQTGAVKIGSRLEPFVDDYLIEKITDAALKLHAPVARDIAVVFDKPWEGNTSGYVTVFQDGKIFRMYYRGSNYDLVTKEHGPQHTCYAESTDGIRWAKPELGIIEWKGSKKNNIVWNGIGVHNFTPMLDAKPGCPPDEKYKALASDEKNSMLFAFKSADGIRWSMIQQDPVIPKGYFDSQNLAFWDPVRGKYMEFNRGWRNEVRDIQVSSSPDFKIWAEPQWLDYGGIAPEHLYTNAVVPYFRAPHILMGFPKRFMPDRKAGDHPFPGVSDGVFMTSRDGFHWKRWGEAFLRPGLQKERWVNRNNMIALGLLRTKSEIAGLPDEISLYSSEGYYVADCRMRRHTVRLDGFVSINAPADGGEFTTKPLVFSGSRLLINFSTSGAGSVRVEIQDESGKPVPGYALGDCPEIYGDEIERAVIWKGGSSLKTLAGKPVRLRFALKDADIYSLRFAD